MKREFESKYFVDLEEINSMEELNTIKFELFIEIIKNFPQLYMEFKHGIIVNWKEEDVLIYDAIVKQYKAKGSWLEYFLLPDSNIDRNTLDFSYKHIVDSSISWYKLAQEVHVNSKNFKYDYAPSPKIMFFFLEYELIHLMLQHSGFTGKEQIITKFGHYKNVKIIKKTFEDVSKLKFTKEILSSPMEILFYEATYLAAQPKNYNFREQYRKFLREQTSCARQLLKNKGLYFAYYDTKKNKFQIISNGVRGEGKTRKD